ncbi:MAG: IclR family transcriptional regulator [Gemmobacter sp.]|nr:IclR family transcriptional regulator [Gemmobacter sp.]
MTAPAPKPQRGVQSLETGGAILREMARTGQPVKLRDLAEALGIAPSQLHPYLVSLRTIRMVEQTETGLYALGPFALDLGLVRLRGQDAWRVTMRGLPALADEVQLMVAVSVWGMHGPVIVYVHESPARIHANVRVGGMFTVTGTATGRLFAAFSPRAMVAPVVAQELPDPAAQAAYWADIARVAAAGYETTLDLPIPGVSAVAAPVFDHTGAMQLAVTVIGPTPRIDLAPDGPTVTATRAFTANLSTDLGHRASP